VLAASRALLLDPWAGHATHFTDPDLRGTLRVLAQLDGAFVYPARSRALSSRHVAVSTHPLSMSICHSDLEVARHEKHSQ
jgi:hypothetical protein